jgi:hypothetical protein
MSPAPASRLKPHVIGLTIGRSAAQVHLAGDFGLSAAADLSRLMLSLDALAYMPIDVDMSDVTLLDGDGVRPLAEATERRCRRRLPLVRISRCSQAARRFLDVSGLGGRPELDLAAWSRFARVVSARPRVSLLAEGDTPRLPVQSTVDDGTGTQLSAGCRR